MASVRSRSIAMCLLSNFSVQQGWSASFGVSWEEDRFCSLGPQLHARVRPLSRCERGRYATPSCLLAADAVSVIVLRLRAADERRDGESLRSARAVRPRTCPETLVSLFEIQDNVIFERLSTTADPEAMALKRGVLKSSVEVETRVDAAMLALRSLWDWHALGTGVTVEERAVSGKSAGFCRRQRQGRWHGRVLYPCQGSARIDRVKGAWVTASAGSAASVGGSFAVRAFLSSLPSVSTEGA